MALKKVKKQPNNNSEESSEPRSQIQEDIEIQEDVEEQHPEPLQENPPVTPINSLAALPEGASPEEHHKALTDDSHT